MPARSASWASRVASGVFRQVLRTIDVRDDRGSVERRAVLIGDALPEIHGQLLAVVGPCPGRCELRDDLQIGRDVDQLVAQRGENDAPHEAAGLIGIEKIGVLIEPDLEFGGQTRPHKGDGRGKGKQEVLELHGAILLTLRPAVLVLLPALVVTVC